MSPSAGFQFSLYFLQTKKVLWKLTGLCYILLFTLCFFADQENGGKALASPPGIWKRADVTFDSNTAFSSLVVSANKKTVKNVGVPQVVPDNPERFDSSPCVLGSPGFRSGKHYFEVKYGTQREWAVGLAGKSVKRKGGLLLVPEERIWQTGLWWLRHLETDLGRVHSTSGKITVYVDYNEGNVTFDLNRIITTLKANFSGEEVVPFFYLGGTVSLTTL
uniref:Vespryn n=1 Tax=Agkistrodon contortrix contortrix TaxID=8713 RepID=A0A1W7RBN2_AGKCO